QETGDISITQVKFVVEGVDEEGNIIGELPERHVAEAAAHEKPQETEEEGGDDLKVKFNPEKYITLEEVKKINKKLKIGDELIIKLEPKTEFGRIAAQTAKQVIIQRLREVEREAVFSEFKEKEGEVASGVVQRIEGRLVYIDLGRTNGLLIPAEQLYFDNYRIGQRLRFLILRVEETNRGPAVLLSRSHPRLVLKLFEFEVPEIEAGSVEIKAIAREAGSRSKVAVVSNEEGVDPIGSLVGQKGVRVQTVINELGNEKIDIIEWSEDPEKFITNALSPAKIVDVKVVSQEKRHALVEVADDQFSLAIGKKGQNVRLAAKLTGWKIDVRAPQAQMSAEEALTESEESEESNKVEALNVEEQDNREEPKAEEVKPEGKEEDKKE
ncbi:MAG: transcription termination factor NusA, partial [Candidatus Paceibacterota bacterium]